MVESTLYFECEYQLVLESEFSLPTSQVKLKHSKNVFAYKYHTDQAHMLCQNEPSQN